MEHKESSVKIYYTKDYKRFRILSGNRQLNERKIERIKDDIDSGLDVLKYCPIIVAEQDGRLNIIDGQHRYFVAKELGSPVWYITSESLTLLEIAKVNSNTEKWKSKDFLNCYTTQDNSNYILLQTFMDETRFPLGVCLKLLERGTLASDGGGGAGQLTQRFQEGVFEVKDLKGAKEIAKQVLTFSDFAGCRSGAFIEAVCRILKAGKIALTEIHEKWLRDPKALTVQRNGREYLNALEVIVNKNAQQRKVIW